MDNNSKKNKYFAIFTLVVALFFVSCFGIYNILSEKKDVVSYSSTIKKTITKSVISTSELGEWTFASKWVNSNNSSAYTVSDDGGTVEFNPTSNDLRQSISLNFSFEKNDKSSCDTDSDMTRDDLLFYIPIKIFDFNTDIELEEDLSSYPNMINVKDSSTHTTIGQITLPDNLYNESEADPSYGDLYYWKTDGDYIVIGLIADVVSCDFSDSLSLTYAFYPNYLTSGSKSSDVKIKVRNDDLKTFSSLNTKLKSSTDISNYTATVIDPTKLASAGYWNSKWGSNPYLDEDGLIFVEYNVDATITSTNAYSRYLELTTDNGELILFSNDGTTYNTVTLDSYLNSDDYSVTIDNPSTENVKYYFVIKYNRTDLYDVNLKLNVISNGKTYFRQESFVGNKNGDMKFTQDSSNDQDNTDPVYPSGDANKYNLTLLTDDGGIGAINKLKNGQKINLDWSLEAATDSINVDNNGKQVKAFNNYNNSNNGNDDYTIELSTNGFVYDNNYNSDTNPYNLNSNNYTINSIKLYNDIEYDYTVSGKTYVLSEVSDYSTYTNKNLYAKFNDGTWELIGLFANNGTGIQFTSRNSDVTFDSSTNTVTLPNNVTDIKLSYVGKRAAVYLGFEYNVTFNADNTLLEKFESNETHVIKSNADLLLNNASRGKSSKGTYLTEYKTTSKEIVTSSKVKNNSNDVITYNINAYDSMLIGSSTIDEMKNYINSQDKGKFYILLPKGINYTNLIVKQYNGEELSSSDYTIDINDNYYDDRKLVVITVNKDNNITNDSSTIYTGYNISFVVNYSKSDNSKYGNSLLLDVAYLSSNLGTGYENFDKYSSNQFTSDDIKELFSNNINIDNEFKKLVFASNTTVVDKAVILNGNYTMEAKGSLNDSYSNTDSVYEGSSYSYKLQYTFADSLEEMNNGIIYDIFNNDSNFNGILDSVDTTYLDDHNINYEVYYSIKDNVDINNTLVTDTSIWTKIMPSDKTLIKAVAISISSRLYGSDDINPVVYLNMIAPSANGEGLSENNKSYIKFNDGIKDVSLKSSTTINLIKNNLSLSTNMYTKLNGELINENGILPGNYGYLFTINNKDNISYKDVNISVNLPEILKVNESGISALVNNVSTKNATYTLSNNILNIKISKIDSNGTSIFVPVSIDVSKLSNDNNSIVINSSINSINGILFDNITSKVTGSIMIPNIEFSKYVNTNDTTIYTNSSSPVLIMPSETYSYMIQIKNTSDVVASDIKVVDNVPDGLTVGEISNDGVYDSSKKTITWNISSIESLKSVELEYKVTVDSDIKLKTIYTSKGHVTLNNPLDNNYKLVDEDTNSISVIYKIATDISIKNTISGNLADKNKLFNYNITLSGNSDDAGEYDIVNLKGDEISSITINDDGNGTSSFSLKGDEEAIIKLLPSGVEYNIEQDEYEGYVTTLDDKDTKLISGTTNEVSKVGYVYKNSYSVSASVNLNGNVKYSNGLSANQFTFVITDMNNQEIERTTNDSDGNFKFSTITYKDIDGLKQYKIYQINGDDVQTVYDNNIYTVNINLINDGKGNLNSNITYYDKSNKLVDNLVFNNNYVPTGFVIGNINTSDYINNDIKFKYLLNINDSSKGSYDIYNSNGVKIDSLIIDDNGEGTYEFELTSDDLITISDLPIDTTYKLTQYNVKYYESSIKGLSYSVDIQNDCIINSGSIVNGTNKVMFNNYYETKASYAPSVKVNYENGVFVGNDFSFLITDISEGSSNGYSELISNDIDGNLNFKNINYTKPGEYKYVIRQVNGDSNHVYYDSAKCFLSVILSDNGDGTMSYTYSYKFDNDAKLFNNKYSIDEIYKNNDSTKNDDNNNKNNDFKNPNTDVYGKIVVFVSIAIAAISLLVLQNSVKLKKFE